MTSHSAAPRRLLGFRLLAVILTGLACLLAAELFLRLVPSALPADYRSTFPLRGIELFNRGVLARTPIDGVPIPYRFGPQQDFYSGPPNGLQALGLVAPRDNPDESRYSNIHFRIDRRGLPNPLEIEAADVLLVGDSFTGGLGALSPAGLQQRLQEATGAPIFNLGIPSIGAQREAWLLREVGLALEPRAVIWFFFGGNDLADARAVERHRQNGINTHADLFPDFAWPRSFVVDLARHKFARSSQTTDPAEPVDRSMPGFIYPASDGPRPVWFYPAYLREMTRTGESLAADRGWALSRDVLQRIDETLRQRSTRWLVVYVPSKPEVYLSRVAEDPPLAFRMASFGASDPVASSAQEFWQLALERRGQLETLLGNFCAEQGIDFLSLTPYLEQLADAGQLGYFSADSHWNEIGQGAALDPLVEWLTVAAP
ncbi:MAG: SGNH/GDSL hydrolase family protein [Acidobacteriota bacterium]